MLDAWNMNAQVRMNIIFDIYLRSPDSQNPTEGAFFEVFTSLFFELYSVLTVTFMILQITNHLCEIKGVNVNNEHIHISNLIHFFYESFIKILDFHKSP